MTALITREPCDRCDRSGIDGDTGAFLCRDSLCGDPDCPRYWAVRRIEDRLIQIASLIGAEQNDRLRSEEAEQVAEAYEEILADLGAVLDVGAFMGSANASESCAKCRTRDLADEFHSGCVECGLGVAA